jgi:acyl carrier protein
MMMQKHDPSLSPKAIELTDLVALVTRLVSEGDLPASATAVALTADASIDDLGLDSLGKLTLLEELEAIAGVELPESFVSEGASLGEIVDSLNALLGITKR